MAQLLKASLGVAITAVKDNTVVRCDSREELVDFSVKCFAARIGDAPMLVREVKQSLKSLLRDRNIVCGQRLGGTGLANESEQVSKWSVNSECDLGAADPVNVSAHTSRRERRSLAEGPETPSRDS